MENANVRLSPQEQELVQNANVLLTKNAIIAKVQLLFQAIAAHAQHRFGQAENIFSSFTAAAPRITRGENYQALPWVVMDYPARFGRDGQFALRHIFLWGREFACTWHISGVYREAVLPVLERNHERLAESGWLLYTGNNEWAHEYSAAYISIGSFGGTEWQNIAGQQPFIKISRYWPLSEWEKTNVFYDSCYAGLCALKV